MATVDEAEQSTSEESSENEDHLYMCTHKDSEDKNGSSFLPVKLSVCGESERSELAPCKECTDSEDKNGSSFLPVKLSVCESERSELAPCKECTDSEGKNGSSFLPVKLSVCVQRLAVNLTANDPFCVIHLGSPGEQLHKFKVVNSTESQIPEGNDEVIIKSEHLTPFLFSAFDDSLHCHGYLVVDVWDHNTIIPDDFLGRVMLPLGEIPTDKANELWYPLMKRNIKDRNISGSLKLKTRMLVGENKFIEHNNMNDHVYKECKSRGFHLSLYSEKNNIVEFPGRTEVVEMAFSRAIIDISSHHSITQVFLTNFRLIILSTSRHTKSHRYHGRWASIDLSMWIALNNIMDVKMIYDSVILHRQKPEQRKIKTVSFTIHCYDVRVVKLTFISDVDRAEISDSELLDLIISTNLKGESVGVAEMLKEFVTQLPKRLKGLLNEDKRVGEAEVEANSCPESENENGADEVDHDQTTPPIQFLGSNSTQLQTFHTRLEHLIANVPNFPPAKAFVEQYDGCIRQSIEKGYSESSSNPAAPLQLSHWDIYNYPKEMTRQGVCEDKWYLSVINGPQYELCSTYSRLKNIPKDIEEHLSCLDNDPQYELCSTYPQLMYIPKNIEESVLQESAKFRSKNRLPCLVWVDKKHQNFMMRCAQPLTGKAGRRSAQDEQLIEAAINAGPPDGHMFIYDARSGLAALGNQMMGKGTEIITGYPRAKLQYLAIPNIHSVRESYDSLRSLCLSMTSEKWYSSLENTQWLNYISLILEGSMMIARYMKLQRGNTLVHCSDGWDRTSQLTSLSQLMMDPYYRTMEGFQILVDKEWLSFGYMFQQRLGHPDLPNERSPIFFQFLDCVHQILMQFPKYFEFQLSYLLCIADHLNTAWFGTFLCNSDKERYDSWLFASTASIWAHLHANNKQFLNQDYVKIKQPICIFPDTNVRRLRLWEEYFLRYSYDFTSYTLWCSRVQAEVEEEEKMFFSLS